VIGNHDVWPYATTYEHPYPDGDVYFANTFADIFNSSAYVTNYNTETVYNPQNNCSSWFQNVEVSIPEEGLLFLGCDFNTRDHALPGYKGTLPLQTFSVCTVAGVDEMRQRRDRMHLSTVTTSVISATFWSTPVSPRQCKIIACRCPSPGGFAQLHWRDISLA
jgi:hypothetical protein